MATQNGRTGFGATFQNRDGSVGPRAMSRNNFRYCKDFFLGAETQAFGGGAASGTAGDKNVLRTGNPWAAEHEYGIIGTQTIVSPVTTLTPTGYGGLDVTLDETLADGVEIAFGSSLGAIARGKLAFKIGTDRPFFARLRVYLADVSGGIVYFGFRKVEAFQATSLVTYTDYATLGLNADLGDIVSATQVNTGGQVTTDTTLNWVDATSRELKILVGGGPGVASGVVQYFIDGDRQLAPPTFTFDAGDVVIPFFRHQHTTDVDNDVILVGSISDNYCFEGGYQKQFGSFDGV
jgi:hypothetical protein